MDINNWSIIYGFFSITGGVISLGIAVWLAPHLKNVSARLLCLLMVAISIWSVGYGMEFFSPALALKTWWVKFEYFGTIWIGPVLLCFILAITKNRLPRPAILAIICLPPIIFFILVITNSTHHLMWEGVRINTLDTAPVLSFDRSPGFWLYITYSYLLISIATILLLKAHIQARDIFKKQLTVIIMGIAFPWLASIIYLFGPGSLKHIDFTPTAFTISGTIFLWGMIRYQMLSMIPLAQEAVINSMGDPVIAININDRILDMNKAARVLCRQTKLTPAHDSLYTIFPHLADFVSQHHHTQMQEVESTFASGAEAGNWVIRIFPLKNRNGRQIGRLLILKDITDKKKAENAVKKSEEIKKLILNASPNPIVLYNHNGEVIYFNPAFTRVFGWSLEELLGKKIDFVPEHETKGTSVALQKTLDTPGGSYDFVTRRLTKQGDILDVSINSARHLPKDGSPPSMVVNFADITQFKKTERELRQTRDYITSIINSLPSMLIGLDANGCITHWNKQAEQTTGISETKATNGHLKEILPQLAAYTSDFEMLLKNKEVRKTSKQHLNLGDTTIMVDIAIYPILSDSPPGVVIRIDDITDRVKIEEMMIQSEKMMSVGGLAAGMAHEINNPLAGIIQSVQVIKNRLTRPLPANLATAEECNIAFEDITRYMKKRNIVSMMDLVVESGLRAAHIVENMLSFSRKSDHKKSTHYLQEIVDNTIDLVDSDYNMKKKYDFRNIKIIKEYAEAMPPVFCEKSQIQQVLLNIIKNGAEAMAEAKTPDPTLIIRCFKKREMAVLEIEDSGPGMDPGTQKRIFEPFFTTKDVGVGTGLGLSVSYFIITENHGGTMTVESGPINGTRLIVKLPLFQTGTTQSSS